MKRRVIIVGNGTLSDTSLALMKPQDFIIGVDRAAYWLIRQGIIPDVAIGDFDSANKQELRFIKKSIRSIKQYPADKNWTDMELAIEYAISRNPSEVFIVGGIGNRHDHTLATMHLLAKFLDAGISHVMIDETNRIRLIGRGKTVVEKASYRYVSILPYTKSTMLCLSGFRYDVPRTTFIRGTTRGISNEIVGRQAEITIFSGKAWVVESND